MGALYDFTKRTVPLSRYVFVISFVYHASHLLLVNDTHAFQATLFSWPRYLPSPPPSPPQMLRVKHGFCIQSESSEREGKRGEGRPFLWDRRWVQRRRVLDLAPGVRPYEPQARVSTPSNTMEKHGVSRTMKGEHTHHVPRE